MSHQTVTKDVTNKSITVERIFNTSKDKLWQAWSDESLLSKWWGPHDWPTTTVTFDFRPGGFWHYYMQGPDGTRAYSRVDYTQIVHATVIAAEDHFSNESGGYDNTMPQGSWRVTFSGSNPCTLTTTLQHKTEADLQKIIDMGFEGGYSQSLHKLEILVTNKGE